MKSPAFTLVLALLLCAAALVGYGIWYTTIVHASTTAAAIEHEISVRTATKNRLNAARTALADLKDDEGVVQSYFVSESAVVAFIAYLEERGAAQKAVVDVLSVSANDMGASARLASARGVRPTLTLSLSIQGTFDAVMRTVGAIEYAPYDLTIEALSVTHDEAAWRANLAIVVGSVPTTRKP